MQRIVVSNTGTAATQEAAGRHRSGEPRDTHNDYGEGGIRSTRRAGKFLHSQEEETQVTLPAFSVEFGM